MIRLQFSVELNYEIAGEPADFIFNIHAAKTDYQSVVAETVELSQDLPFCVYTDPLTSSRFMRLTARTGQLRVRYRATVDISHHVASPEDLAEIPVSDLPASTLPYLISSRYCQSDRLRKIATQEFGGLPRGYSRIKSIQEWVRQRITFQPGSSTVSTSAVDTLIERAGVCRDFAHVMIALCRGVNLPARFVTGIDYGAPAALGPTDFHAYVEAFLSHRWFLFDPMGISPLMGLVRLGTGRDAADVSFATIFGPVRAAAPVIDVSAVDDPANGYSLPDHGMEAISTGK